MAVLTRALLCACSRVHDHDLPGMETGSQNLFDVEFKGCDVGRSFQDQRGSYAVQRKGGNECCILAPIARHASSGAFSLWRTGIQGGQSDVGPTLINNYQQFGRKLARVRSPDSSFFLVALRCPERLLFASNPAARSLDSWSTGSRVRPELAPRGHSVAEAGRHHALVIEAARWLPPVPVFSEDDQELLWAAHALPLVVVSDIV